ncbi:MAG: NADP-dependent oxidoreductase [Ktedonobacteraceae bacterium]|nr:NADP-dependent oxidoreductase [Ktedonobacteraceae bacterium]
MSTETMKAIQVYETGGPEVLIYENVPRPVAGPGEVLIRVYAVGTNPAEWRGRAGFPGVPEELLRTFPPIPRPYIPGTDVSGIVEAVGPDVTRFHEGDAVYGMLRFPQGGRAYAEYTTAPVTDIALKPATIDHIHAAAIPMAALTAWQLLCPDLEAGQTVLINGAAGGVGHFAVQLAKLKGARVIGVASGRNAAFLRDMGVDEFVDYTTTPVEQTVHDVDLVFDTVGGEQGDRLLSVLRRGGRLIPINIGNYSDVHIAEAGVIRGTSHQRRLYPSGEQLTEIGKLIDAGNLRVFVEKVFPLSEARKAHEFVESHHLRGKMVLNIVE